MDFMQWRLAQTIRYKALGGHQVDPAGRPGDNPALAGHIIHRLIGSHPSMQPYLPTYDQSRAEHLWRDWQAHNLAFVENAVLPRGEVGLNPRLSAEQYDCWLLSADPHTGNITDRQPLNVKVRPAIATNMLMGSSFNPKATVAP
jgi:hypothetical protein